MNQNDNKNEDGLTKNQRIFIDEYLKDRNGTRAYRVAYPNCRTEETARVNASKLLAKANIWDAVTRGLERIHEEAFIEAADIRRELARIGFSDIRDIFDDNGNLKPPKDWDDKVAAAVSSVEVVTRPGGTDEDGNKIVEYVHKIKTWDKKGSLELLGKELAMFTDKVDHSSKDGTMSPKAPELTDEQLLRIANGNED